MTQIRANSVPAIREDEVSKSCLIEIVKVYSLPWLPYLLHRSDKYLILKVGTREDNVLIDRLKAAYTEHDVPVQVAQPPRRGRPPMASTQAALPDQQITPLPVPTYAE